MSTPSAPAQRQARTLRLGQMLYVKSGDKVRQVSVGLFLMPYDHPTLLPVRVACLIVGHALERCTLGDPVYVQINGDGGTRSESQFELVGTVAVRCTDAGRDFAVVELRDDWIGAGANGNTLLDRPLASWRTWLHYGPSGQAHKPVAIGLQVYVFSGEKYYEGVIVAATGSEAAAAAAADSMSAKVGSAKMFVRLHHALADPALSSGGLVLARHTEHNLLVPIALVAGMVSSSIFTLTFTVAAVPLVFFFDHAHAGHAQSPLLWEQIVHRPATALQTLPGVPLPYPLESERGLGYAPTSDMERPTLEHVESELRKALDRYGPHNARVADWQANLAAVCAMRQDYERAIDALEVARRCYEAQPLRDAGKLAAVLGNLGAMHMNAGTLDTAIEYLGRALELERRLAASSASPAGVGVILVNLGMVYRRQTRIVDAKKALEEAWPMIQAHFGFDHPCMAVLFASLGATYLRVPGRQEEGRLLLLRSLTLLERHFGNHHIQLSTTLDFLADVYGEEKDLDQQVDALDRALAIRRRYFGREQHDAIAHSAHRLALAHKSSGNAPESFRMLDFELTVIEQLSATRTLRDLEDRLALILVEQAEAKAIGNDNAAAHKLLSDAVQREGSVHNKAYLYEAIADVYNTMGDRANEAQSLQLAEARLDKADNLGLARIYSKLGIALTEDGRASDGVPFLEQAVEIFRQHPGQAIEDFIHALVGLGNAYGDRGDAHGKLKLLAESYQLVLNYFGGDQHVGVARVLTDFANAKGATGDLNGAIDDLEKALAVTELRHGDPRLRATILSNLSAWQGKAMRWTEQRETLGRLRTLFADTNSWDPYIAAKFLVNLSYSDDVPSEERLAMAKRALEICLESFGDHHIMTARAHGAVGCALALDDRKRKDAVAHLETSLKLTEQYFDAEQPEVAVALAMLAQACDPERAEPLLQRALRIRVANFGRENVLTARSLYNLADCHRKLGQTAKAREEFEQVLQIRVLHAPPQNSLLDKARYNLKQLDG